MQKKHTLKMIGNFLPISTYFEFPETFRFLKMRKWNKKKPSTEKYVLDQD